MICSTRLWVWTWLATTCLSISCAPCRGDPASMTRGLAARFTPIPARVGVDMPVQLTTASRQTLVSIQQDLRVTPPVPISVYGRHTLHFTIMPRTAWPAKSRVTLSWMPTGNFLVLTTDDNRTIKVNLSNQRLTAWRNGKAVRTMAISTGVAPTWSTPTGTYWIYKKILDDHMVGKDPKGPDHWDVNHVPYAQYFKGAVAIHGAWWNHHFGRPASHGCVQVPTAHGPLGPTGQPADAQWLWHFTDIGTPVIVTGKTPVVAACSTGRTPIPQPQLHVRLLSP